MRFGHAGVNPQDGEVMAKISVRFGDIFDDLFDIFGGRRFLRVEREGKSL